ncbi:MAG: DUF5615 family PIN-like protein [candidate division KSB1 bacterium]|nr:DUF5615 family PIN-like protein [candidate division KSB1 bacterium]MDZ7369095.1 DUF5615 family PIN-like protein [candidate division KSB1 bacterium]MDZ7407067.1 DUF5615 family PIN-like protein [candidate division KSB1 bacterium]
MTRLYANENFPLPVVEALRRLWRDMLTTQEAGTAGQSIPDEEVLAFACTAHRALLTINRKHFIRLHSERPHHEGIIVCTFDPDFGRQATQIHAAITSLKELGGQLIRVTRPAL